MHDTRRLKWWSVWPVMLVLVLLLALFGPAMAPYDVATPNYRLRLSAPSFAHLLGTDHLGRDIASRVLHGARASLGMSIAIATLATLIGVAVGITSGIAGGRVDAILTRLLEIVQSFPGFLIAIAVAGAFGSTHMTLIMTLAALGWAGHARLARGLVRSISAREHVIISRLHGSTEGQIIRWHYLPAIAPAVLVSWSENWSRAILAISGLGFLGLGVPPPEPEWGAMLADGRTYLGSAPLVMFGPGLAVVASALIINLFGDWLRDRVSQDDVRAA